MKKSYYSIIMAVSFLLLANGQIVRAQDAPAGIDNSDEVSKPQNVGNKICPVSGEKVGQGGMNLVIYEYDGKIYNFCCTACVDEFKKEPQKYIQKVEEELKTAKQQDPAEKTDMNKKDEMPMDMHGGHHK